ncbi:shikimate dehydrogenase [Candidatus Halobeggiatoa sp. HSG11]|nr:shikimate dehydrogenase [Candidatus Halobeggiatoa sp. HSG11]
MINMNTQIDQYAVIGNPISHSKSPLIHSLFAKQTEQSLSYNAILAETEEGEFIAAVQKFRQAGGKGLNITVPFKQIAWELVTKRSERAELAGAINTIWFDEQGIYNGENTDGIGLIRDLTQNHDCQILDKKILILGAGGAVRGILEPLLKACPTQCIIANRTISKAEQLAELFAHLGEIKVSSYGALAGQSYDLIINGTSTSLQGKIPPLADGLVADNGWCYDMMYANTATPFMQWAKNQGATNILDGLGMLVEQAAESFYIWRKVKPDTTSVIKYVREQL